MFHVQATETSNSCGQGALGSTPKWEFDVRLSRGESQLFWDTGGEVVPGVIASDGVTFSLQTGVVVDMRTPADGALPPCTISRTDTASGVLDGAGTDASSFTGELSYEYTPTAGSSCTDLVISEMPVFAALPCKMAYTLTAQRTGP
jgi:hypothetical protein